MTKDVIEAIKERRSVRSFKADIVPDATISRILEAGMWAPSMGNIQPWQFFVVKGMSTKERLAKASLYEKTVTEAPFSIVVCVDTNKGKEKYGARGQELYAIQDGAVAIQNMLLAATAYGLGSLWIGDLNEREMKDILNLQEGVKPLAVLPMGYADFDPQSPPRKSLEDVVQVIED